MVGTVLCQVSPVRIFDGLSNKFFPRQSRDERHTCAALLLLQDVGAQSPTSASVIIVKLGRSFRVVGVVTVRVYLTDYSSFQYLGPSSKNLVHNEA